METKDISIENFDPNDKNQLINSPTSLEACNRQGLEPKDLQKLTKNKAKKLFGDVDDDILELYIERHEERRKRFVKLVKKERKAIIRGSVSGSSEFSSQQKYSKNSQMAQEEQKQLQKLKKSKKLK